MRQHCPVVRDTPKFGQNYSIAAGQPEDWLRQARAIPGHIRREPGR